MLLGAAFLQGSPSLAAMRAQSGRAASRVVSNISPLGGPNASQIGYLYYAPLSPKSGNLSLIHLVTARVHKGRNPQASVVEKWSAQTGVELDDRIVPVLHHFYDRLGRDRALPLGRPVLEARPLHPNPKNRLTSKEWARQQRQAGKVLRRPRFGSHNAKLRRRLFELGSTIRDGLFGVLGPNRIHDLSDDDLENRARRMILLFQQQGNVTQWDALEGLSVFYEPHDPDLDGLHLTLP